MKILQKFGEILTKFWQNFDKILTQEYLEDAAKGRLGRIGSDGRAEQRLRLCQYLRRRRPGWGLQEEKAAQEAAAAAQASRPKKSLV